MAIQPHSPLELEPWNDLNRKVVMLRGASSGLSREICLNLAKAGCKIIAVARRMDRLQSLRDEINRHDFSASSSVSSSSRASFTMVVESRWDVAVELDVNASGKSIEKCVRKAWDSFGFIDTLVNNTGVRGKLVVVSLLNLRESIVKI